MAYPGLTFAILVGVAIGTAIYYYFNQEDNQQQRQQGYEYQDRDDTSDSYDSWTGSRSSSTSGSKRRRRNSGTKCSICLDDLSRGKVKTLADCGHEFHEHCVTVWIRQNKTCPNCRSPVFL